MKVDPRFIREEFFQLIDKTTDTGKDFTSGNDLKVKEAFVNCFESVTNDSELDSAKKSFMEWVQKAKKNKQLTSGNAKRIKSALNSSFKTLEYNNKIEGLKTGIVEKKLEKSDERIETTIHPKLLSAIESKIPRMYQFLTDPNFTYDPIDYDLGFEKNFGVIWLKNDDDSLFLKEFNEKYDAELLLFTDEEFSCQEYFSLRDTTRLADSDIAHLLDAGTKNEAIFKMLQEALTYCLSKINPDNKVFKILTAKTLYDMKSIKKDFASWMKNQTVNGSFTKESADMTMKKFAEIFDFENVPTVDILASARDTFRTWSKEMRDLGKLSSENAEDLKKNISEIIRENLLFKEI